MSNLESAIERLKLPNTSTVEQVAEVISRMFKLTLGSERKDCNRMIQIFLMSICKTHKGMNFARNAPNYMDFSCKVPSNTRKEHNMYCSRNKTRPVEVDREMPRMKSSEVYKTAEWRRIRMVAIQKYGARCQCCGRSAKDGIIIHVDHIKPISKYPELAFDVDNLQILCEECNQGKSNLFETDFR